MKKSKNSQLDERQQQTLSQIEHRACYLAYWGLLAVILLQLIVFDGDGKTVMGEWIIFMATAVYLTAACLKHGIWSSTLKPDLKTNVIVSVIAAIAGGLLMGLVVWFRYPSKPAGAAAAGIIIGIVLFVLCFLALSFSAGIYKKRSEKLEEEPEEKDE
ncbi:MAG: hypothetical protein PUD20_12270 [bacterium]|nr:hypothetical protein [bacterium]